MVVKSLNQVFVFLVLLGLGSYLYAGTFTPMSLRGYGNVSAEYEQIKAENVLGSKFVITCQNETFASKTMSKIKKDLSISGDLLWNTIEISGKSIPYGKLDGYGVIILYQDGKKVVALGAESGEDLIKIIKSKNINIVSDKLIFDPATFHPMYLDRFDWNWISPYVAVDNIFYRFQDKVEREKELSWLKRFKAGVHIYHIGPGFNSYEEDITSLSHLWWLMDIFKENGIPVTISLYLNLAPTWVQARYFDSLNQPSEDVSDIWGWWNNGQFKFSYASSNAMKIVKSFIKEIASKGVTYPNLVGWMVDFGNPHPEMCNAAFRSLRVGYEKAAVEQWHQYLKKEKGYDLEKLGLIWHNDSNYYRSWEDVFLPKWQEFFGYQGNILDLAGNWQYLVSQEKPAAGWSKAIEEDSNWEWIDIQSFRPHFFSGKHYYRRNFEVTEEFLSEDGDIYLYLYPYYHNYEVEIYLNGEFLGLRQGIWTESVFEWHPTSVKLKSPLNKGENVIAIVSKEGLNGPIFFSHKYPKKYPYSEKGFNDRYVNFSQFMHWSRYKGHKNAFEFLRQVDSETPITIAGPGTEMLDYATELAVNYGGVIQFTGEGAWFSPWYTSSGYGHNFYGTAESGHVWFLFFDKWEQADKTNDNFKMVLGWMLFKGSGKLDLFPDIFKDICGSNKVIGDDFEKNKKLLSLCGKSERIQPTFGLLMSSFNERLEWMQRTPRAERSDWGRGGLPSLGIDWVYLFEEDFNNGYADRVPVVMDLATGFMSEQTIDSIINYVRNGGVFIVLHYTGRHSLTEPNTWPIEKLTGFKVIGKSPSGTGIKILNDQDIWTSFRNMSYSNQRFCADWEGQEEGYPGLKLEPISNDTESVAVWEDGTTAVGIRYLGKGKVVTLGSAFWGANNPIGIPEIDKELGKSSIQDTSLFKEMLINLGVRTTVKTTHLEAWARHHITKDGRQEWMVVINHSDKAITTDLYWQIGRNPEKVTEILSGKEIVFACDKGSAIIKDIEIEPKGVKVFAIKRSNIVDGLQFWFTLQNKYWKALTVVKPEVRKEENIRKMEKFIIPLQTGWCFIKGNVSVDCKKFDYDDSLWLKMEELNLLPEKSNHIYMRKKFDIPEEWIKKETIDLLIYEPVSSGSYIVYLNGEKLADNNMSLALDIGKKLKGKNNIICIELSNSLGLCGIPYLRLRKGKIVDISGQWKAYKNRIEYKLVEIPGVFEGISIQKEIQLHPKTSKAILYVLSNSAHTPRSIMVNNRIISQWPLKYLAEVDLVPYVKEDGKAIVEIWPLSGCEGKVERLEIKKIWIEVE